MLYGIDGTKFWETEEENGNNLFLLIVPEIWEQKGQKKSNVSADAIYPWDIYKHRIKT